jgi:GlpG protein
MVTPRHVMRPIGKIDNELLAGRFSRFLHSKQIAHELEESGGAWDVWVISEDDLQKAADLFKAFLIDPHQPGFLQPPPLPAGAIPTPPSTEAVERVRRLMESNPDVHADERPRGASPFTLGLIGICLLVHLLKNSGYEAAVLRDLFMTAVTAEGGILKGTPGLPELQEGQLWRLFTPAIVHADWLHLLLNMVWLLDLGNRVERRRGPAFLGIFVLTAAAISNYGQYVLFNPAFCGMSGVLYALLGYVWMKSKHDPASGLQLPMQNLVWMLIWFGLCLAGIIPNVANGAHAVGLAVGTLWGILASLPAMKRTRA